MSTSKERLKTKDNRTLHVRIGYLHSSVLCIVVEILPIDVLFRTAFTDGRIHAILADEQKAAVQKRTTVFIVQQHDVSGDGVLSKHDKQDTNMKTQFGIKRSQGSTVKQLNTSQIVKRKILETLSVAKSMPEFKWDGLLHFAADPSHVT